MPCRMRPPSYWVHCNADSFCELEATIVCLTMQLRGADDDAYDAHAEILKILWRRNIALLIFLRMVYIFDLLNWLSSLIANWK